MTQRAAIYARVSTDEQAEHGYSLQTQIDSCRKYAADNGFQVVAELREEGVSGAKLDRPELDKLRGMIDLKQLDAVIVHAADRLSRNLGHSILLREEWQRAGIEIHYADRGKSHDTSEGRLSDNVQAVIAEYEREKIRERTRRGKMAKAKSGKLVGDGSPPYGYRRVGKDENTHLEIDEYEAAIVRRIFAMYLGLEGEAVPIVKITAILTAEGVPPPNRGQGNARGWYKFTARAILRRSAYVGEFRYTEHTIHLPDLAILDREIWEAAQKQIEKNKQRARRNRKREYLLSNHLTCACGLAMVGKYGRGKGGPDHYRYYACARNTDAHLSNCKERNIRADIADPIVWEWVYGLTDDTRLEAGIKLWRAHDTKQLEPKKARIALLDEMISKAKRQLARLARDLGDLDSDEGRAAIKAEMQSVTANSNALRKEREAQAGQLAEAELTPEREATIRAILRAIRARIDTANFEQRRELLNLLDFRAQLEYKGNRRGLYCTCGLAANPEFLAIDKCSSASSSPTGTALATCRPASTRSGGRRSASLKSSSPTTPAPTIRANCWPLNIPK